MRDSCSPCQHTPEPAAIVTHACNYRLQAEREQAEFEAEWEELGQMVEQDRRMPAFMAQVSEWVSRSKKE